MNTQIFLVRRQIVFYDFVKKFPETYFKLNLNFPTLQLGAVSIHSGVAILPPNVTAQKFAIIDLLLEAKSIILYFTWRVG